METERETKPAKPPETKPETPGENKGPEPRTRPDAPIVQPKQTPAPAPKDAKAGDNGPPKPDFDAAAKIIRDDLATLTTRGAKINGDKSASWKRVQDECHVNKAAAKDAAKIAGMSDEMQSEYLRSLFGLLGPLGIGVRRDLVDLAEGVEGLIIPLKDAPESELESGGSVASKAMRETAASDKAAG